MPRDLMVRFPGRAPLCRVHVARGALARLGTLTRRVTRATRAAVITDARVARLHGARALASLRRAGIDATWNVVPSGEAGKTPAVLARAWEGLAAARLGRRDAIVALGGGAVSDLAGFAAATFLRGIPWVCAPTTLLAQVDASLGGKTAVNLSAGKNLAGAFHQPSLVLADPETLATLPARQLRAGLAEAVKMGFAVDAALFRWLEEHAEALRRAEPRALEEVVRRAVAAKLRVVRRDPYEREGGIRTALNYGHTLGHAIEAACGFRGVLHGEAVAIGMRAAALLSVRSAGLAPESRARLETLLDRLGLPRRMPRASWSRLLRAMEGDKKRAAGRVRWVLTPRVGHASVPRPIASRLVRGIAVRLGARA